MNEILEHIVLSELVRAIGWEEWQILHSECGNEIPKSALNCQYHSNEICRDTFSQFYSPLLIVRKKISVTKKWRFAAWATAGFRYNLDQGCAENRARIVKLEIGGKWSYSCCFMGCCFQDLFNIARSILVQFSSGYFSICFVSIHVVHPYSSIDTTTAWKKSRLILSDRQCCYLIKQTNIL